MKVTKLISNNTPKVIRRCVNNTEKETAKAHHTYPKMSTVRTDLELRAEMMPAEDYIRIRTYLSDLEQQRLIQNTIF